MSANRLTMVASSLNAAKKRGIVIVGAGGHGREVGCVALAAGFRIGGFLDDCPPTVDVLNSFGADYLGPIDDWQCPTDMSLVFGLGSGNLRQDIVDRVSGQAVDGGLVDPRSMVGVDVSLAPGSVIFAFASVTTNISIGRHSHIGRGAAIGHDCVIGDFVTVMPLASVSGNVHIGAGATIGSGAVIRQGQTVGAGSFVGAGAVVVSDVPPGLTVVGNPAVPIRGRN